MKYCLWRGKDNGAACQISTRLSSSVRAYVSPAMLDEENQDAQDAGFQLGTIDLLVKPAVL